MTEPHPYERSPHSGAWELPVRAARGGDAPAGIHGYA